MKAGSAVKVLIVAVLVAVALPLGLSVFYVGRTIFDLLGENKQLKTAIANLTAESQIGYAKVLEQKTVDGRLVTKILFVETDRNDPARRVLEKQYEIAGDVVHFDALVVKFAQPLVADGRERALYLWRRVYGEGTPPEQGFSIETAGDEPQRYADLTERLSLPDRKLFWSEVWKLSNDPNRLKDAGIQAIYGNVNYRRLRPGLIYVFRIANTGTLYSEIVPDL